MGQECLDCIHVTGYFPVVRSCGQGDKPSTPIKDEEFIDQLSDCQLPKVYSLQHIYLV
jgi:hypothetical protein